VTVISLLFDKFKYKVLRFTTLATILNMLMSSYWYFITTDHTKTFFIILCIVDTECDITA